MVNYTFSVEVVKHVRFKFQRFSAISNHCIIFKLSKVVGCALKRIGDLSFEFYRGACGTFMFPQERILLCFAGSDKRKCERSVHYKVETLQDLKLVSSVTMAWLFISMQIRRLNMRRLP